MKSARGEKVVMQRGVLNLSRWTIWWWECRIESQRTNLRGTASERVSKGSEGISPREGFGVNDGERDLGTEENRLARPN